VRLVGSGLPSRGFLEICIPRFCVAPRQLLLHPEDTSFARGPRLMAGNPVVGEEGDENGMRRRSEALA